jgi:AhpD family alkylhydroperoxidase
MPIGPPMSKMTPTTTQAETTPLFSTPAGRPDAPRIPPARNVRNVWVRLFAWMFRRELGKVMTPVWVIYARIPRLLWPQMLMVRLAQKGLSLDPTLVDLVQIRVSAANGCTFCTDLHRAVALRSGRDAGKVAAVDSLHRLAGQDGTLSDAERVALTFADEIAGTGRPTDATFAALRATFGDRAIVELVWLCSFTVYLNRMATALGIGSDGFCQLRLETADATR